MARKGNKLSSVTGSLMKSNPQMLDVRGRCTARSKGKIKRLIVEKLKNKGVTIPDIFRLRTREAYQMAYDNGIDPKDPDEFPYSATRCSYEPIPGGNVCRFHGGRVPVIAQRAAQRLIMEAPFAVSKIHALLTSDQMTGPVIAAAKLVMDGVDKYNQKQEQLAADAGGNMSGVDLSRLDDQELEMFQMLLKKAREPQQIPDHMPNDVRVVTPSAE